MATAVNNLVTNGVENAFVQIHLFRPPQQNQACIGMKFLEEVDASNVSLQHPFLELPSATTACVNAYDPAGISQRGLLADSFNDRFASGIQMELRTKGWERQSTNLIYDLMVGLAMKPNR